MEYLVSDPREGLEFTEEDFKALRHAGDSVAGTLVLKFCVMKMTAIEQSFWNPQKERPLTESETWGFIQARGALQEVVDFLKHPPIDEEQES